MYFKLHVWFYLQLACIQFKFTGKKKKKKNEQLFLVFNPINN